jgi:hypothetical protein
MLLSEDQIQSWMRSRMEKKIERSANEEGFGGRRDDPRG